MLRLNDLSHLKGYGFPRSVIGLGVRACHHFTLCLRDIEGLLAERGIIASHE